MELYNFATSSYQDGSFQSGLVGHCCCDSLFIHTILASYLLLEDSRIPCGGGAAAIALQFASTFTCTALATHVQFPCKTGGIQRFIA